MLCKALKNTGYSLDGTRRTQVDLPTGTIHDIPDSFVKGLIDAGHVKKATKAEAKAAGYEVDAD